MKSQRDKENETNKVNALAERFFELYDKMSDRDLKEFDSHIENAFNLVCRRAMRRVQQ